MAKKRKASRQPTEPAGPKDYDPKDARLGPITTFEDIADEQEEYFLDKDRIPFEDEPGTKRQRRLQKEDEFLELSDDEVLGGASDSDDSEDDADRERRKKAKKVKKAAAKKKTKATAAAVKDDEDEEEDDDVGAGGDEEDEGWWGASKNEYYDGDAIETEDNALEEEAEARRLQKRQLARMTAADFFDADDWAPAAGASAVPAAAAAAGDAAGAAAPTEEEGEGGVVTVTMKTDEELALMTDEEKNQLMDALYPEFNHMCDEFAALEPLLADYQKAAEGRPAGTLEVVAFRVLAGYLATLALYFTILMAPTRDNPGGPQRLTPPEELHDHEVMEYLVEYKQTWERVKRVEAKRAARKQREEAREQRKQGAASIAVSGAVVTADADKKTKKSPAALLDAVSEAKGLKDKTKKKVKGAKVADVAAEKEKKKDKKRPGAVSKEVEESLADLSDLLKKSKKSAPTTKASLRGREPGAEDDDEGGHSDFGEEETLDARTAEEKQKRKKSLGFYTSQIMQKSNLRSGAGRTAGQAAGGGDLDIPYRERLKDRQARLNAAAVKRGQSAVQPGEELGGEDSEDGDEERNREREANLAYYDNVVQAHQQKLAAKAARKDALAAAKINDRVVPVTSVDAEGRRQLTWEIEKNKGLSHRTLKEKKNNPRVKKRVKFEKKKRQLASMRPVYKAGVDRTRYQGELTGIKTDLVRSVKLG